jgi:Ca-activated chloride channel family protein
MNHEFEESKLTSYALGELDENTRREMDERLAGDESARQEVEQIRAMAGMLKEQLATEPLPEPKPQQMRRPITLVPATRLKVARRPVWRVRIALAAAACLMLGGLAYSILAPNLNRARETTSAKQPRYEEATKDFARGGPVPSLAANDNKGADPSADAKGRKLLLSSSPAPVPAPGVNAAPKAGIDMVGGAPVLHEIPPPLAAVSLGTDAAPAPVAAPAPMPSLAPAQTLSANSITRGTLSVSGNGTLSRRASDLNSTLSTATLDEGVAFGTVSNESLVPGARGAKRADEAELTLRERAGHNTEAYDRIHDNPFLNAMQNPLSTFSIDVDSASYSNVRRFLQNGQRPPKDAVRIEELVNYFPYDYEPPAKKSEDPFATHVEIAGCPWNNDHRLVRVALKGKEIAADKRPASNLVFLIDVSGSMNQPNKLPLVKSALRMLTEQLNGEDRVAMVVYAGNAGVVLSSTSCRDADKQTILTALDNLEAGGSTNGAQGIEMAYKLAQDNFIKGGTNRVILCTDGDFNVGVTNQGDLTRMIESKAKDGVFLSVMGFGMGNLKDSTMEKLADKGNGNYGYIDTENEAKKVFVEEISSTLVTIAKDVKIQIEFNPAVVGTYRLIGYENRMLAKEDFNNDKKDAGEIGAGHAVTALYEVTPAGGAGGDKPGEKEVDDLHFQKPANLLVDNDHTGDMLILKLRYKQPEADKSKLIEITVKDQGGSFAQASGDFKFASAVAAFGMILRDSPHKGSANFGAVEEWAGDGMGKDTSGYRKEFLELVKKAKGVKSE